MKLWTVQFMAAMFCSGFVAFAIYGLLGPAALILWSMSCFGFGAMWAVGKAEIAAATQHPRAEK